MRALAILVGLVASVAAAFGAYSAIRAVGPPDRTGDFGYGDAALAPPGGGTLLQSRNFKAVIAAMHRELGDDGRLQSLDVEWTKANAVGVVGNQMRYVDIDAAGRSQSRSGNDAGLGARVPLAKLDPEAIDKLV